MLQNIIAIITAAIGSLGFSLLYNILFLGGLPVDL